MTYRHLFSLAVALGIAPATLAAQGAFGSALAVSGRDVYVGQVSGWADAPYHASSISTATVASRSSWGASRVGHRRCSANWCAT